MVYRRLGRPEDLGLFKMKILDLEAQVGARRREDGTLAVRSSTPTINRTEKQAILAAIQATPVYQKHRLLHTRSFSSLSTRSSLVW